MSWDSKPSYPTSALHTVTVKATAAQVGRWTNAAKRSKLARGAFVALAVDAFILFEDARRQAFEEYQRAMQPEGSR